MIKDLNEANQKISELETKNKQNDKDVEMLKGETRSVSVIILKLLLTEEKNNVQSKLNY